MEKPTGVGAVALLQDTAVCDFGQTLPLPGFSLMILMMTMVVVMVTGKRKVGEEEGGEEETTYHSETHVPGP